MTLNISVIGKFDDKIEDLYEKEDAVIYQVQEDDPQILSMNNPFVVSFN